MTLSIARRAAARLALGAIAPLIAACSVFAPPPTPGSRDLQAERHPDRAFEVRYGDARFLVDVRYIDVLGESVIAVRAARGRPGEGRQMIDVAPSAPLPETTVPFSEDSWRRTAVSIADAVSGRPPICVDGQTMRLARNDDQGTRTLFRRTRGAWVVFAFCPPTAGG